MTNKFLIFVKLRSLEELMAEAKLKTAGGKITCSRCQAMSKRSGEQCGAPAERGKPFFINQFLSYSG